MSNDNDDWQEALEDNDDESSVVDMDMLLTTTSTTTTKVSPPPAMNRETTFTEPKSQTANDPTTTTTTTTLEKDDNHNISRESLEIPVVRVLWGDSVKEWRRRRQPTQSAPAVGATAASVVSPYLVVRPNSSGNDNDDIGDDDSLWNWKEANIQVDDSKNHVPVQVTIPYKNTTRNNHNDETESSTKEATGYKAALQPALPRTNRQPPVSLQNQPYIDCIAIWDDTDQVYRLEIPNVFDMMTTPFVKNSHYSTPLSGILPQQQQQQHHHQQPHDWTRVKNPMVQQREAEAHLRRTKRKWAIAKNPTTSSGGNTDATMKRKKSP